MSRRSIALAVLVLSAFAACRKEEPSLPAARPAQTATQPPQTVKADLKKAVIDTTVKPDLRFLESCAIGAKPGADGTVTGEQTDFKAADPIYVTVKFRQSPEGLQSRIEVVERDAKKEVFRQTHEMKGAFVATFTVPPKTLKAARVYHVTAYWGGNSACEWDVVLK